MALQYNDTTAIGDSFEVHSKTPIIGIKLISGYTDVISGETGTRFFNKEFKYSINGITYSDWVELTDQNLVDTFIGVTNIFDIIYRYTRAGADNTGLLTFWSVQLEGVIDEQQSPKIFDDLYFSKFFDLYDSSVLGWALNVLNKLYNRGIVADYIDRGREGLNDDDYLAFFGSLTHFFAVLVRYAREFKDFTLNDVLLNEYLKQKGLFVNDGMGLADLRILLDNLYINFLERGTGEIVKANGVNGRVVDGELLRLIRYSNLDEFIWGLIEPEKTIWNINNNSPLYRGTKQAVNIVKAYEFEQDIQDLTNYPLNQPSFITKYTDGNKEVIRVLNSTSTDIVGIGDSLNNDKLILVNPNINYEITFWVSQAILSNSISLEVNPYDKDELLLGNVLKNAVNGSDSNNAISQASLLQIDTYYFIRVILFTQNVSFDISTGDSVNILDIGFGNHLVMNSGEIKYIDVNLGTELNDGNNDLRIWDFKVRPLIQSIPNSFIMIPNIILSWLNNNSELNNIDVKNNISRYLIPYNSILNNEFEDEPFIFTGTPLSISVLKQDETVLGSNNGQITILASGGTSPYQYSIDNGVTFFSTNVFSNLSPAAYNIVVEDAVGTQVTDSITINQGVSSLGLSLFATQATDPVTPDGELQITAFGGVPPYLYSLDDITYVANNIFTGLGVGTYTGWVRDNTGLKVNDQVDITAVRENTFVLSITDELGADLENVNVEVNGENYLTDVNGEVTIYLADGAYNFTMSKAGYQTKTLTNIAVSSDRNYSTFINTYYSITFNVTSGGSPLSDVTISSVFTPSTQGSILETPPNNGTIVVNNVIPGNYSFDISKSGYITVNQLVTVNSNETVNVSLNESIVIQEFLNVGNFQWIVPNGVTSVEVECYGGGASGTGVTAIGAGDGGAGGQYSKSTIAVVAGEVFSLIVGAGGVSDSSGTHNSGEATVFVKSSDFNVGVSAIGGAGRLGSTLNGIGDIVRAGGDGALGSIGSFAGGGGGGAGSTSNGGNASGATGGTGGGGLAGNGGTSAGPGITGLSGNPAGGGGSGAWLAAGSITVLSGAGGKGAIKLTYQVFN